MSLLDLHSHNIRCGHADNTVLEMAEAAAERGITIFGASDHAPLFAHELDQPQPGIQMARSEWSDYLAEVADVRRQLEGRVDVRIGVEADWLPGTEDAYREALTAAPLDHVLGSVHNVGPVHIYMRHTHSLIEDVEQLHRDYWQEVRNAAESGLFDIIAHVDAVKARLPQPETDMTAEIENALDCIADTGMAVEINSSGLRRMGELYPSPEILEGLVRRDVPITFGSDSHMTSEVGYGWKEAVAALRQLGVSRLVAFRERQPEWVSLD